MDLLENIPSVQLDFEGKLSYRGEGTFKVYINGHPVANGEEKLRQLPANQIDKIEIITNPSAKYHAEGTAGIIQIILKKNRLEGYAISSSIKVNSRNGYDWLFSVDHKGKKSGWYMQGQWSRYVWTHYKSNENQLTFNNDLTYETKTGKSGKRHKDYSYFETGFNYDLSDKDYINFSGYIYPETAKQVYRENGHTTELITDESGITVSTDYNLDSRVDMDFQYVGATFTWDHAFNKKRTHMLSAYLDYSGYLQDLHDQQTDRKDYDSYTELVGYKGSEQNEIVIEGKLNYTLPVNEKTTFEVGAEINTDHIPKLTSVSGTFDEEGNITRFEDEPPNQSVNFEQDIYAAYLSLKKEWNKVALQLGIRTEYTERRSDYSYDIAENEQKTIPARKNYMDFFPSGHLTYSLSKTHQFYMGYSRRINRPNYWSLIPLEQYESPYSVYKGNGELDPSFTNSFETGYKKSWDKDFISTEIFFRQSDHVIQNYSRTRSENKLVRSPENIGKSSSLGAELMTGADIVKWWNVNLSTTLFYYQLDIDFEDMQEKMEQIKSNTRFNNTFRFPKSFTLKWDLAYNSPLKRAQTKRDGYFVSNLAIKKSFGNDRWNTTLLLQ
jgi:outer membrane receptor protein involved in Fe transport